MTKPYVIALTGCIGSGKSTVAKAFKELGALIIDADALAREVVVPGSAGLTEIQQVFGPNVILSDGQLDRRALRDIIFKDTERRKKLEEILHPKIRELFLAKLANVDPKLNSLVVYEVPLFFESKFTYPEINAVVVVAATRENCLARIAARDNSSLEAAEKALDSQIPIEEKIQKADYVIHNNGSKSELEPTIASTFKELTLRAQEYVSGRQTKQQRSIER